MGFFDRFKKKKEEKNASSNVNNSSALSNEDELLRKYNEAMRSIDEQDAELERQWHRVDAKISNDMKNLENLPENKKYNDLAAKRAKDLQEEMRQKEFAESLLGQKYANVRRYVQLKEMGLQPGANFSQKIKKAAIIMEEYGYSLDCLLLPFLIEKRAKNLLDPIEKEKLDSIVGYLSDEELSKCLSDSLLIVLASEVLGPFKTDEDKEIAKLFISSFVELESLDKKMGRSKR